jgi:hypothetical protein
LNYLDLINMCIADFDKCLSFFALAHGYPRSVPSANVKDKDELRNYLLQQKRATLIVTETRPKFRLLQIKGTLKMGTRHKTSIEIWKSQYPLNLLNLTETENIIQGQIELDGTAPLALAGENSSKRLQYYSVQHWLWPPSSGQCLRIARLQRPLRKRGDLHLGTWRARGSLTTKIAQFEWINRGKTG